MDTHRRRRQLLATGSLKEGETDADAVPRYVVVDRDGSCPKKPRSAKPISDGGSSVVYRAVFKGLMPCAIKVLDPRPDLTASRHVDHAMFKSTFEQEIRVLASVTHEHVVKLIDFGTIEEPTGSRQYYVMDYVEGYPLDEFWVLPKCTADEFLSLFGQVLRGVAHLHSRQVMHCDLKPRNILVRNASRDGNAQFSAVIVDLGVAKYVGDDGQQELFGEDGEYTRFFSTDGYVLPRLESVLANKTGNLVRRSELRACFPYQDLYSLGVVLNHATSATPLRAKLRDRLGAAGFSALERIQRKLSSSDVGGHAYDSVDDVARDWRKLFPNYLSPLGIPELSLATGGTSNISTTQGRVGITDRVYNCIGHPLFQRLQNIPQLELLKLIYPGARHSRFLHSLNSFNISRLYVANLLNDPRFRLLAEPTEIEATLLKALLHDVGHYPFSHMFEDFVAAEGTARGSLASDDHLFPILVGAEEPHTRFSDEFVSVIRTITDTASDQPFREVVARSWGEPVLQAVHRLAMPSTPESKVCAGVISSPCDADKVAYLRDDSMMTGVGFGLGIDLEGLVTTLVCPGDEQLSSQHTLRGVLAFREKGLAAAEGIVLARYWMIRRVYWHHVSRSIMAMFKYVIGHLLSADRLDFPAYLSATLFKDEQEAVRWLSERYERNAGEFVTGSVYRGRVNPLTGLIDGNRSLYKRLVTISHAARGQIDDSHLYDQLANTRPMEDGPVLEALAKEVSRYVGARGVKAGEILLDVPWKKREHTGGVAYVYADRGDTLIGELMSVSPVLGALKDEFDSHAKKCRILVHPGLAEALGENFGTASDAALHRLRSTYTLN